MQMLSGWAVVTCDTPQHTVHAHLSHSQQRSSPGLWTVLIHWSLQNFMDTVSLNMHAMNLRSSWKKA